MTRFKRRAAVGATLSVAVVGIVVGVAVAGGGGADTNPVIDMSSTSGGANGYSLVDAGRPNGAARLSGISNLSLDYAAVLGGCGGGSPRFIVNLQDPNNRNNTAFLTGYVGPPPNFTCSPGDGWTSSGNLADAGSGNRWAVGNSGSYRSYDDPSITAYSDWRVTDVQLVVDSGWAFPNGEDIVVKNVALNNRVTNASAIR